MKTAPHQSALNKCLFREPTPMCPQCTPMHLLTPMQELLNERIIPHMFLYLQHPHAPTSGAAHQCFCSLISSSSPAAPPASAALAALVAPAAPGAAAAPSAVDRPLWTDAAASLGAAEQLVPFYVKRSLETYPGATQLRHYSHVSGSSVRRAN